MDNEKILRVKWQNDMQIHNCGIPFTRDNICIDREIDYEDDIVLAYVEVWFDAEKKFGIRLLDGDYVNVYAHITPDTGDLWITYIVCHTDGNTDNECVYTSITEKERDLIWEMVNEISLKETGMTVNQNWSLIKNQDR